MGTANIPLTISIKKIKVLNNPREPEEFPTVIQALFIKRKVSEYLMSEEFVEDCLNEGFALNGYSVRVYKRKFSEEEG